VKSIATALVACSLTLGAHAQSLPPSVAACADEADVLKRLSCYDHAVAPYLSRSHAAANPSAAAQSAPAPPAGRGSAAASVAPVAATANPPAADSSRRVQARIASIDSFPDGIVVHLDNGQVWQEDEDTPVDLGLRPGDSVTIEHQVGSFWITGRHGATAKVRLKN
jgi:hypothetical protein